MNWEAKLVVLQVVARQALPLRMLGPGNWHCPDNPFWHTDGVIQAGINPTGTSPEDLVEKLWDVMSQGGLPAGELLVIDLGGGKQEYRWGVTGPVIDDVKGWFDAE